MPPMNPKNMALSPAATDLGLGDMLRTQTEDETEEQRRKRLAAQQMQSGVNPLSLGTQMLFGGGGGYRS